MRKTVSALAAAAALALIGARLSSAMPMPPAGIIEVAGARAPIVAQIQYYPGYRYYEPYYFRPYEYYAFRRPTYYNYYQTYGCYWSNQYCLYYW